jgi:uncharacterized delta-60 repeat protein
MDRNNKLIVAGFGDGGLYKTVFKRYNNDGSLDTSFNGSGTVNFSTDTLDERTIILDLQLDNNNNIIASGYTYKHTNKNNTYYQGFLVKIQEDGNLDTSFNNTGYIINNSIYGYYNFIISRENKIFIRVYDKTAGHKIYIINDMGTRESSFSVKNNEYTMKSIGELCIDSDGGILVSGMIDNGVDIDLAILKIQISGEIDTHFGNGGMYISKNIPGVGDESSVKTSCTRGPHFLWVGGASSTNGFNQASVWSIK